MTEKTVIIWVTRDFRSKIKAVKRELTYEQYFSKLIKKNADELIEKELGLKEQDNVNKDL